MSENLMDAVRGQITPEAVEKAAGQTGESPDNTRTAMHGAISTVFAGLTHSASTRDGAERITGALGKGEVSGLAGRITGSSVGEPRAPGSEGASEGGSEGHGLIGKIFGDRSGAVTGALAESSGIKSESASHVLAFVAPLVAGVVGKEIFSRHLDAGGVSGLLMGHRKAIVEDPAAPRGLAGALGMSRLSDLGGGPEARSTTVEERDVRTQAPPGTALPPEQPIERPLERARTLETGRAVDEHGTERALDQHGRPLERARQGVERERGSVNAGFDKPRSRRTWALPVLLLGALAVWGIFALGRGRSPTGVTARQPALPSLPLPELPKVPPVAVPHIEPPHIGPPEVGAPQAAAPQAGAPQTAAPQAGVPQVEVPQPPGGQQIALPGGATLNVDPNGPQAYLARSLADSAQALPQTFQFDKLTFDTGAATLSADSDATKTIDDVATVLKAYPESHVRVVGHTDDRGDPAANEALSEARAKTVQQMLVERGVAADRIETGSKSDTEAVTGNDTEEGRTRNRRADVVLLSR